MKIFCKIGDDDACIVGYAQAVRGKVRAIVISKGQIRAVKLKEIRLRQDLLPEELNATGNVTQLKPAKAPKNSRLPDVS